MQRLALILLVRVGCCTHGAVWHIVTAMRRTYLVSHAGVLLLQGDSMLGHTLQCHEATRETGLWMAPLDEQEAAKMDEYGRPRHWANVGAVLEPCAGSSSTAERLTWVRVRDSHVAIVRQGGVAVEQLQSVVEQKGGLVVESLP